MNPDKKIGIIVCPGHDAGLLALKIAEMKMQDKVEFITIDEAKERGITINHPERKPPAPLIPDLIAQDYVYVNEGLSSRARRRKEERESKKNKNNNPFSDLRR